MRINTSKKSKIVILLTLLVIIAVNSFLSDFTYTSSNLLEENMVESIDSPKNNDLSSNNVFTGTGEAWNVTHWANRTDYDLPATFGNNSYDLLEVPLGIDWIGYNLKADINNLYDSRNWNNGTFNFGNDDGTYAAGEDDTVDISNSFQNWTFNLNDGATANPMSGNYLDSVYAPSDGHNCLELRMDGNPSVLSGYYNYNENDKCWWNSTFVIPRGTVIDSELQFDINPNYLANFNSWDFAVSLNNQPIYSSGTYSLKQLGEGNWQSFSIPQSVWVNQSTIYTSPVSSSVMPIEFSLEYVANSASYSQGFTHIEYQQLFIDNVKLIVKAEVQPSQIQLKVNNTGVSDVDWGKGTIELTGDWQSSKVITNFSSDDTWDLGSYDIELDADLNLFANKHTPETSYDTNFVSEGISFYTENNSLVNWECYAYFAVPTGYEETTMKLEFPSDVTISWASEPQQPTINRLALCDDSTAGVLLIPVDTISTTPDGFWKFEGTSSNYCEQLTIYKNSTNSPTGVDWVQEHEFLSGDFINVTAKVNPSPLVSSYITQTNAIMNIRFPNGTIWTAQNQIQSCDSNGMVYFDYFQVPLNSPNYEVGEYDVIITWNNSHSIFGLNESGIIYKKFTVKHFSSLTPDQQYYADILEGSTINLIVSFTDRQNGDAIENAIVYLYNFTGGIEYFNEINPGFYALLDFNTTGGLAGDNILSIYANSTLYTNNQVNTTINLILKTTLSAEEFPYLQSPWNQNFTIHLNYTEKITGNGIVTSPTTNWIGDYSTIMTSPGAYNMTFNSSAYEVNKLHSLIINVNESNYEQQSILIKVEIIERSTYLDEIFLNDIDKTTDKSITLTSGELLNITLKYKDSVSSNFISGASSAITGGGLSGGLNENFVFNHYDRVINSSDFELGATFLIISMQAENYSATAVSLTIFVSERGSIADVFINGTQHPDNYVIVEVWQTINITITYDDLITGTHLSDARVELLGIDNLTESLVFEQYTILIDAAILGQGIDILNIIARKDNYESQPLQVTVEIVERKTDLHLYINGLNKTLDKFIELPIGSQLNFTIDYFDSTGEFVTGSLVQLLGEGLSLNLTENIMFNHYSITINTNQLDIGIRLLTIIAFKNNYQIQTIGIRLDIQRIKTNITTTSGESVINISPGETVSLKIILYDLDFGGTIKNATVSFTWSGGSGTLTDANNDGIYEAVLSNIPDGSHTITISAYAGDDYSFERYEVVITVIRPAEDVLLFWILLIVSSIATVSALTYLILYQKIFKYPKPVRKVRKYRKTLRKTKKPGVDITAREKAFKGEYQNQLAKSSKFLKGKPAEVTPKPDKMLKEPIEGSDQ